MDGLFSVDDDIDFSDDDIVFNNRKEKQTSIEDICDTVPVSIDDSNSSLLQNIFKYRRNSSNNFNIESQPAVSQSCTFIENQSNDIILNDTDTDTLLSQIEMPINDNYKPNTEKQRFKSKHVNTNNPNNEIDSQLQSFQSLRNVPHNGDIMRGCPEIRSNQAFINEENYSQNIPVPFCNEKQVNDICTQSRRTVTTSEQVTPIKYGNGKFRANKRTFSDSHEKISVKPSSTKQRRFPGPAGLLPSIDNFSCLQTFKSPEQQPVGKRMLTPKTPKTPIQSMLSSSQDDDFKQTIWSDVQQQVKKLFPTCEVISKILHKATMNQLNNGKVSLLCGLIKSFCNNGSGGRLVLKDPTGEINGTVHKNVLHEYETDLLQGSGMILKDISVFSPTLKKHYINITPSNIVQIFPAECHNIIPTQLQYTQLSESNTQKENVTPSCIGAEQEDNAISKDSGNNLNEEKDIFENEEDLNHFFSDDLRVF